MTAHPIDPDRPEVYREARSNVHPIEIRTQLEFLSNYTEDPTGR